MIIKQQNKEKINLYVKGKPSKHPDINLRSDLQKQVIGFAAKTFEALQITS